MSCIRGLSAKTCRPKKVMADWNPREKMILSIVHSIFNSGTNLLCPEQAY
jgi:hypothetical protein